MEINTLKNKLNEIKKSSNLIYDLKSKEMKVLAKELKENDEIIYIIFFLTGLRTHNYLLLTKDTLYYLSKGKLINRFNASDCFIEHVEKFEEVMGKMTLNVHKNTYDFKLYNVEIKNLALKLKKLNQDFVYDYKLIEKQVEVPMKRSAIVLRFMFVIIFFLTIVAGVVFLMWKLKLL